MDDTLLTQRQYFDKALEKLSLIKDLKERYSRECDMLYNESQAEFSYRSGLTRGKIIGLDLEKFMSDIIDGMDQTCERANPSDFQQYDSAKNSQAIIRAHGDCMLRFALDYVDRWVMYNNLFNKKE